MVGTFAVDCLRQGYRHNELYVGSWIDVIVEHSFKGSDTNDVFAAECLSVLLDENEQLLDQVITADVVAQFGHLLRTQVRRDRVCGCAGVGWSAVGWVGGWWLTVAEGGRRGWGMWVRTSSRYSQPSPAF